MGITKVPFGYIHPNKKIIADAIPPESKTPQLKRKPITDPIPPISDEVVLVRLGAHIPSPGVSAEFDAMIKDSVSQSQAMLAILTRGLTLFEDQYASKSFKEGEQNYAHETDYIETNRTIRKSTLEWVRQHFDPHGILSARALGGKLGTVILAQYFVKDNGSDDL